MSWMRRVLDKKAYIAEKVYLFTQKYQTIMKKILLHLLTVSVATAFFVSCQKDEIVPEPMPSCSSYSSIR